MHDPWRTVFAFRVGRRLSRHFRININAVSVLRNLTNEFLKREWHFMRIIFDRSRKSEPEGLIIFEDQCWCTSARRNMACVQRNGLRYSRRTCGGGIKTYFKTVLDIARMVLYKYLVMIIRWVNCYCTGNRLLSLINLYSSNLLYFLVISLRHLFFQFFFFNIN